MADLLDRAAKLLPEIFPTRRGKLQAYAGLAGLGVLLCLIGLLMVASYARLMANGQRASAEVVRQTQISQGGKTVTVPVLRYNATSHHVLTETYPYVTSPGTPGSRLTVVFDPSKPDRFEVVGHVGPWLVPAEIAGVGLVTIMLAAGLFNTTYRQEDEPMRLKRVGRRVQARISRINATPMASGPALCDIEAEWQDPDTGQMLRFRSKEVDGDPALLGGSVTVLFDPAEPARHLMESEVIGLR